MDGATSNDAAIKGLDLLASIFKEVIDEQPDDAIEGRSDARHALMSHINLVVADKPKKILCVGHYVKNRVIEAHKRHEDDAAEVVRLLSSALYDSTGPGTRRHRLRQFLRERQVVTTKASGAVLQKTITSIHCILQQQERSQRAGAHLVYGFDALVAQCIKDLRPHAEDALGRAPDSLDVFAQGDVNDAIDFLREALPMLESRALAVQKTPYATLATINQTRWHTSVYAAYEFLARHLGDVRDFLMANQGANPPQSVVQFLEKVNTPEKLAAVQKQLDSYITSLAPVAQFLTTVSDVSATTCIAPLIAGSIVGLAAQLRKNPKHTIGYTVGELLHKRLFVPADERERLPPHSDDEDMRKTFDMFFHVSLFSPGHPVHVHPRYLEMEEDHLLTARAVAAVLNMQESDLPEDEWANWLTYRKGMFMFDNEVEFWSRPDIVGLFPNVSKVGKYVVSLPVAVTSCDSVLSVLGNTFSTRQNRLGTDVAGLLLAFKANGDQTQSTVPVAPANLYAPWGARKKLQP
jgi:hypothetical protein